MKIKLFIFFLIISSFHYGQNIQIDKSKLLDNYYRIGIPSLDKEWSAEEYLKAINLVLGQNDSGSLALPSKENGSIDLLNKLTDTEKFWFLNTDTYTENSKLNFTLNFGNSLSKLLVQYMKQGDIDQKLIYSFESVKCYVALLKILNDNNEYAQNIVKQNPNLDDIQKKGLQQMKDGTSTVLSGCFITLQNDYKFYNEKDICDLSPKIFDFYSKNRNFINEESRKEFDAKTILLHNEHQFNCVRQAAVLK